MKNFFRSITLFALLLKGTAWAQQRTIAIVQADTVVETESYLDGEGFAYLRNTTNSPIRVIVVREDISITAGHVAYYCWGPSCYSPNVFISTDTVTIAAQGTETSFKGYLSPNGVEGISKVKYCFKDITNNSTPTCLQIQYLMGVVSINGKISRKNAVYPNPAHDHIIVKKNGNGTAFFEIFDMTGKLIMKGQTTAGEIIPIEKLNKGLYQIVIRDQHQIFTENFIKL